VSAGTSVCCTEHHQQVAARFRGPADPPRADPPRADPVLVHDPGGDPCGSAEMLVATVRTVSRWTAWLELLRIELLRIGLAP
jgi:hypothetical protein